MTEKEALGWVDTHLFYTMHWFPNSIGKADPHSWDAIDIEWPDETETVLRGNLATWVVTNFDPW